MNAFSRAELINLAITESKKGYLEKGLQIWLFIRKRYPDQANAWSEPVYLCLYMDDYKLAEKLAQDGIKRAPQFLDSFVAAAYVSRYLKKWPDALFRYTEVIKRFPDFMHGYEGIAKCLINLGHAALAEGFAATGISLISRPGYELFLVLAEALVAEQKFAQADEVLEILKARFPGADRELLQHIEDFEEQIAVHRASYGENEIQAFPLLGRIQNDIDNSRPVISNEIKIHINGTLDFLVQAKSCLARHDIAGAGKALIKASYRLKELPRSFKINENLLDEFIGWAQEPEKQYAPDISLKRWQIVHKLFPDNEKAWINVGRYLLAMNQSKSAANFCATFPEQIAKSPDGLLLIAEAYARMGNEIGLLEIADKFGIAWNGQLDSLLEIIEKLCKLKKWPEAYKLAQLVPYEQWSEDYIKTMFILDYKANPAKPECMLMRTVERLYTLQAKKGLTRRYYTILLTMLGALADSDPLSNIRREKIIGSLIAPKIEVRVKFPKKLCFTCPNEDEPFFAPIIKCIPPDNIDLVFSEKTEIRMQRVQDAGLGGYNIFWGKQEFANYEYVICSRAYYNVNIAPSQKIINLHHATDAYDLLTNLKDCVAIIYPFSNNLNAYMLQLQKGDTHYLDRVHTVQKCEIASTGPYHAAQYVDIDKTILREECREFLKADLPDWRPMIFCLEDEVSHQGQIIHALNRLADFATVIYKGYKVTTRIRDKIRKEIIVADFDKRFNNLVRFSSDYIMCGFASGSLTTSALFGMKFIPFYSKYVRNKSRHPPEGGWHPYQTLFPCNITKAERYMGTAMARQHLISYLQRNNMLFDLVDDKRIRNAIEHRYIANWIEKHKVEMQKEIFGEYMLAGAAEKTAALILRFVEKGTFGDDCKAVYFKPSSAVK